MLGPRLWLNLVVFSNLEEMQLGWTETRDAGALAFGSSDKFKNLKNLDLRGNFLSNKTKEELKKSLGHLKTSKAILNSV